jgi:hypothetical protein
MPDEPQGRWFARLKGQPVKARTYHLYEDCGMIRSLSIEQWEVGVATDEIIDLCGLHVCTFCDRRSHVLSYSDVIGEWIKQQFGPQLLAGGAPNPESVDHYTNSLIDRLSANGYVIRQERKVRREDAA